MPGLTACVCVLGGAYGHSRADGHPDSCINEYHAANSHPDNSVRQHHGAKGHFNRDIGRASRARGPLFI